MKNSEIILRKCSNPAGKFSFFIFPLLLFFYCGQVNAQVTKEVPAVKTPAVKTGAVNAGSLVTQFMNAIKPSSFTDQWAGEKSNWLASASKIASAPGMVESVSSLAKSIKPSMFKEGFKLDNLLQTATQAKSMATAAGLLKGLEGGLKPEAMVSSWAGKKNTWLKALNLLK